MAKGIFTITLHLTSMETGKARVETSIPRDNRTIGKKAEEEAQGGETQTFMETEMGIGTPIRET